MKETIRKALLQNEELYRSYYGLPWPVRLRAAAGLVLLYLLPVALTFLAFRNVVPPEDLAVFLAVLVVTVVAVSLDSMLILVPVLRRHYQALTIGAGLACGVVGAVLGARGPDGLFESDVFKQNLDLTVVLVWAIGTVAALTGVRFTLTSTRALYEEKARRDADVELAREIQGRLLPPVAIENPGYQVYGMSRAASEVGGDYFEVVELAPGRVAFAIGDVSGHGLGAGLLGAMVKSALLTELRHTPEPAAALLAVNRLIRAHTDRRMFVTLTLGVLDVEAGTVQLVNAGHPPAFLRRLEAHRVSEVRPRGVGLGLMNAPVLNSETIQVQEGDTILLVTDGIIEAADASGDEFGIERVSRFFEKSDSSGALGSVCDGLFDAALGHSKAEAFKDDATLLALRVGTGQREHSRHGTEVPVSAATSND